MSDSSLSSVGHSFRRAGKALEQAALQFRSYFLPSHIRTYWRMVRRYAGQPHEPGRKVAFFDFNRAEIDNVGGRYLFALVRDFEALGFSICFRKRFRFLATMECKLFKGFLLDRPFRICESISDLPEGSVAVEVTDRRSISENPAHRQIRVSYDASWPRSDREVPMSFFVHPVLYDQWLASLPPDLAAPRPWRVFFSGRVLDRKYGLNRLQKKYGKMSRQQIMETLAANLPAERLRRIETAADLEPAAVRHPCFVWSDMTGYRIPQRQWFKMLDRADFFLACPGMDMPLCHNLIEALARGAVPILEYPEFLDPPLEHDVNCLAFRGRDELIRIFEQVFQFSPEKISRLRLGAYAYYQKHLSAGAFALRLISAPHSPVDLLLNAYRTPRPPSPRKH